METRITVIGITMENKDSVEDANELLHQCSQHIIERMELPCVKRKVSIIDVIADAPQDIISALSGKLGRLQGINSKVPYSNIGSW